MCAFIYAHIYVCVFFQVSVVLKLICSKKIFTLKIIIKVIYILMHISRPIIKFYIQKKNHKWN